MPNLPSEDQLRELLLNPPLFSGQVMQSAGMNQRATIKHPNGRTVRATAVMGDVIAGNASVFQLDNGGYIAIGEPRSQVGQTRYGQGIKTIPEVNLVVEDPQLEVHYVVFFAVHVYHTTSSTQFITAIDYWMWDGTTLTKVISTGPPSGQENITYQGIPVGLIRDLPEAVPNLSAPVLDEYHFVMPLAGTYLAQAKSYDFRSTNQDIGSAEAVDINTALVVNGVLTQEEQIPHENYPSALLDASISACTNNQFYPAAYTGATAQYETYLSSHYGSLRPDNPRYPNIDEGCDTFVNWEYRLGRTDIADPVPWADSFSSNGVTIPPQTRGHLNISTNGFYQWLDHGTVFVPDPEEPPGQFVRQDFDYRADYAIAGFTYTWNRMTPSTGAVETGEFDTATLPYEQITVPLRDETLEVFIDTLATVGDGSLSLIADGTTVIDDSNAQWTYFDTSSSPALQWSVSFIHLGTKVVIV